MAVKMGGAFHYEDIIAGSRVVGTRTGQENTPVYEPGKRVKPTSSGVVHQLPLLGREQRQAITANSVDRVLGMVVTTTNQDGTRKYRILPGQTKGLRRQRIKDDDLVTVNGSVGQRINKVLTGIGAFGIGYNPTPTTPECKPIRKYPRDWHGENMH